MAWKGAIGKQLQSIKFMACPTSPTSAAVRYVYHSLYELLANIMFTISLVSTTIELSGNPTFNLLSI